MIGLFADGGGPETQARNVGVHHTNLPRPGELSENFARRHRANSEPAVSAKDKELGHIPNTVGAIYEDEAGQFPVELNQERMPVGIGPIEGKRRIGEAPVVANLDGVELAEVVDVEIEEISENRLAVGRCWKDFDLIHIATSIAGSCVRVVVDRNMKNPPHPGRVVLEECIEPLGLTITDAAAALGVTRNTLSELVNGKRGISPEMAVRLSKVFGGSEQGWLVQQAQYELAQVHRERIKLKRLQLV